MTPLLALRVVDRDWLHEWTDEEELRIAGESQAGSQLVAVMACKNKTFPPSLTTQQRLYLKG
ncbi:MAG: hypothetical protein AAF311_09615 [Pseudomonadota bacterium]